MMPARPRAPLILAVIVAVIVATAAIALVYISHARRPEPARPPVERPKLLLITSLPLIFAERFSLEGGGSPALRALETRYRVMPIGVADGEDLKKGRLLLMAHPLAQPADDLVELDHWVRAGGRVLLLADPLLEWPSERPLGDPLRAPPMFMDTGLLAHWGVTLSGPRARGPALRRLGGFDVLTVSPGEFSGSCAISADRLVAHCRLGKGRATIIADADFLDTAALDQRAAHNLDGLLAELARLEAK